MVSRRIMKTAKDTHRLIKSRYPTHEILASDSHARPLSNAELGGTSSKAILGASSCSNLSQILEMEGGDSYRPRCLPHSMCRSAFEREFFNTGYRRHIIAPVSRSPSRTYNPTHGLRRPAGTWKKPSRPQTPTILFHPFYPPSSPVPPTNTITPRPNRPREKMPPQNLTSLASQPHPHSPAHLTLKKPTPPANPTGQPHQPTKPAIPKIRTNARPAPSAPVPQSHNAQPAGLRSRRRHVIVASAKTLSPEKASVVRWWGAGWRAEEGRERSGA